VRSKPPRIASDVWQEKAAVVAALSHDEKGVKMQSQIHDDVKDIRHADYEIDPIFLNRWSPRAFSSEPISEEILRRVFEAARWSPSSFNEQPWRFIIARREEDLARFVDFLMEANQAWAKYAPVLIAVISKKTFTHNDTPNAVYQFDAGCAWGYISLAAAQNGLITHGMAGFDRDKAREVLGVTDDFDILAIIALGRHGDAGQLPEPIREREVPSGRRLQVESVMEGKFSA
jgi:nitroreductase